jgi:hypothetical protein
MVWDLRFADAWQGGAGFGFPCRSPVHSGLLPREARSGVLQQLQCFDVYEGAIEEVLASQWRDLNRSGLVPVLVAIPSPVGQGELGLKPRRVLQC